jgi:hypothetical protein
LAFKIARIAHTLLYFVSILDICQRVDRACIALSGAAVVGRIARDALQARISTEVFRMERENA